MRFPTQVRIATTAIAACAAIALGATAAQAAASAVAVTFSDNTNAMLPRDLGHGMTGHGEKPGVVVALSSDTAAAGPITFHATNTSANMEHRLVIFPLRSKTEVLPYVANSQIVNEKSAGLVASMKPVLPGGQGRLQTKLKPGKYILVDNLPGHYAAGGWALLTVK